MAATKREKIGLGVEVSKANKFVDSGLQEVQSVMMVGINSRIKELQQGMKAYKIENTNLEAQIVDIKKENEKLRQLFDACNKKLDILSQSIGSYKQK